jgi:hypothetical protein
LVALAPPFLRPPFTITAIWPEVLHADAGMAWLRGVIREEAAGIAATEAEDRPGARPPGRA